MGQICEVGAGPLGEATTPDTGDPTQPDVYWAARVTDTPTRKHSAPGCRRPNSHRSDRCHQQQPLDTQ